MAVVHAIATRTIQKKVRDLELETFPFYREQVVHWRPSLYDRVY